MDEICLERLQQALIELEDADAVDLTRSLLDKHVDPVDILTTCEQALATIGMKYETGEYYISGLIMAGDIMSRITEVVTPLLTIPEARKLKGRVLIGTVEGDIHDLGKNIAGVLLSAYGFVVKDLGVDVPADDFVHACRDFAPDAVGLSALLTTCLPALHKTVIRLKEYRSELSEPAIIISGAQIGEEHRRIYGADYQAETAFDTVRICEKITTGGA